MLLHWPWTAIMVFSSSTAVNSPLSLLYGLHQSAHLRPMKNRMLLAIDQGTTSTRAILFDARARPQDSHAVPLKQIYPAGGWVEHDPEEIWRGVRKAARAVLKGLPAGSVA